MLTHQRRISPTRAAAFSKALASSQEHRFAPRRRGQIPALIQFDHMTDATPCILRDMSTTGARIEVRVGWDASLSLGSNRLTRLRLIVRHDRTMYDCCIVRHTDTEIGVKFLSAPKSIKLVGR